MRPCISSLLVPHIYKQLLDHPSVYEYEDIKGFDKNMFFINHGKKESSQEETKSHINSHEAEFIVELSRHIILQGYDTSQVTILTTYSGQLHLIRQLMRKHKILCGVRATVVDNYQGEENDIILLSFVRSNEDANIGFLKTSNRVNVALSRARKGLYCIGNFDCLAEKSQLWQHFIHSLEFQKAIGDGLEIYCQNHLDYKKTMSSKEDFLEVPDGGCMQPCAQRLPCGHVCPSVCHIVDTEHKGIYRECGKKCDKIVCENEHRCQKKCHFDQDCGKCMSKVQKVRPQCGHSVRVSCSSNPAEAYCRSQCQKERSCGHKCNGLCNQLCEKTVCNVMIEAKSPCGHIVKIECSKAINKGNLLDACTKTCDMELKCGHICKGTCGRCKYGRLHISCSEKCTRILICGHACAGQHQCGVDCKPCRRKCTNGCVHSKCPLKCGEPCAPCMEKCQWRCDHLKCSRLCSEPCDRQLCELPSTKILRKCGHQSIGVCGEKSPSLCRICDKEKVEEIFFGNEGEEDARFIELEDCKHIIEVTGLMNWMNDKPNSGDGNRIAIQLKKCPKCNTEIRHTKALNTFIQASLKDVQQVKLKTYGGLNENRKLQRDLNTKTKEILDGVLFKTNVVQLREIYLEIFRKTKFEGQNIEPKSKQLLIESENGFRLVETLQQICLNYETRDPFRKNICDIAIAKFEERIHLAAAFIKGYRNSEQKRYDIETEISFLQMMADVIVQSSNKPFNENGKLLLNNAFEIAHKPGSATENVRNEFKKLVDEAFKHATGLGISIEEKRMILEAMDLQRGHWYKCPNGHPYVITECGGAMQESKCNECGAAIGGGSHQLRSDNDIATEMDGATEPAWPTNLMRELRPFMED